VSDANGALQRRVLVLAPTAKDGELVKRVLGDAHIQCDVCPTLRCMCDEIEHGAAAVLVPEEAIVPHRHDCLSEYLAVQPPWSDLPVLILARQGADSASVARAMDLLGNVTVLERPMRVSSLVSAVRSALRARRRQYQLREHLAERERAEEALRKADRRKDEFLAILAHELRNPLAPIRNSLYILQLTGRDDPTARRVGEMMERQVSHMVRLVDDLLEVSRITRGKIELRNEDVELAGIIHNAVETSRPLIDAARHDLAVSLPVERLTLVGDSVRLAQVFSNLLNNAAKYTDPGGRISVTATRDGDDVVISLRDTGAGIPRDMLPRVFELFAQVDGSANRKHGGLGIGLTLAKSLVEMHGGSIEARSDGPGKGSEFVVRLPLARHALPVADASPASAPAEPCATRRVLVVDDNRDAAESLALLLRLLGMSVRVVNSGAEALKALDEAAAEVVLLDIGMPGMDGYEVARRIRQRAEFKDVRLVALTGWGQDEDRRRSSEAGFDQHLIKPADVGVLKSLLGSLDRAPTPPASLH